MSTFLAFLIAVAKLFYAQPWSKILLLCFAVFVCGCICGLKLTRGVVKAVTPERKADDVDRFPRIKILRADEPATVEAKSVPKMPEAANHFADTGKMVEPKASATVCVDCPRVVAPKQTQAKRRFFGRWR